MKYPLSKPYITDKEKKYVMEVLDSDFLSMGEKLEDFEKEFTKKIGTKYACAVSSGTAGLHLALISAGIKNGDEVITTPLSFVASANTILYVGAKPVFADIDASTYNIDPEKIEEKITKKTKALLVVHIFGQVADMKPINTLAKKHNLKIIEDACESIISAQNGILAGTFGESAVFAFYPNKQMTTGEGGMIVTNEKSIYELCVSLRNQGRSTNTKWLDHERLGYNYRMDELSAAVGLAQLENLDYLINERKKICSWYNKHLAPHHKLIQVPQIQVGNEHSWFTYVITVKGGANRDKLIEDLEEQGIQTKAYLPSIHLFGFYKNEFGYKEGDYPVSEKVSSSSLALPLYIGLEEKDIEYIVSQIIKALS